MANECTDRRVDFRLGGFLDITYPPLLSSLGQSNQASFSTRSTCGFQLPALERLTAREHRAWRSPSRALPLFWSLSQSPPLRHFWLHQDSASPSRPKQWPTNNRPESPPLDILLAAPYPMPRELS